MRMNMNAKSRILKWYFKILNTCHVANTILKYKEEDDDPLSKIKKNYNILILFYEQMA